MKIFLMSFVIFSALTLTGGNRVDNQKYGKSFSIASFNVRTPVDKAPNDWGNRRVRLLEFLKKQKFDIFGVQEVVNIQIDDIKSIGYAMIGVGRNADLIGEFSSIFYKPDRFRCLESKTFWLSDTPDVPGSCSWQNFYPRICTFGIFQDKISGKKFVFANTHLDHKSIEAQVKGTELIIRKLLPLGEKYPLILSGDFNSRPGTPQILRLKRAFRDTRIVAKKSLPGPAMTYHGYHPATPRFRSFLIDYIFVNDSVHVESFQVIDDRSRGLHTSDHYPLKAVVTL